MVDECAQLANQIESFLENHSVAELYHVVNKCIDWSFLEPDDVPPMNLYSAKTTYNEEERIMYAERD